MAGFINMETAASNPMQSLLASAAELQNAWSTAKSAIQDGEGGIGDDSDILVRPFRDPYETAAFWLKKTIAGTPGDFRRLVDEYQKALDAYLAANKAAEQGFPRPR
jgi:hypothetical protein